VAYRAWWSAIVRRTRGSELRTPRSTTSHPNGPRVCAWYRSQSAIQPALDLGEHATRGVRPLPEHRRAPDGADAQGDADDGQERGCPEDLAQARRRERAQRPRRPPQP
jgi:hypothetical protein